MKLFKRSIQPVVTALALFSAPLVLPAQGIIPDPGYEGGGTDTVIVPTVPYFTVVKEYTPFVPLTTVSNVTSTTYADRVALTRYYKDGFNSTYKSVAKDNVSGRDIISFSENYPRQEQKDYLPFPSDVYVSREDLVEEQNDYYSAEFPLEVSSGDAHAYTITDITSGSTARSHKVYAPGKELVGTARGTEVKKTTNGLSSIRKWEIDANGKPYSNGFYIQGQLFGEQATAQNGVTSTSYTDKSGNLVCKVQSGPSSLVTYYVYDDFNRLRAIISPKATVTVSGSGTLTDEVVKNLCFLYFYDARGRLSKEQKPGEDGFTELVYDRKGRIVMRRSPSELTKGLWELVFYDKLGRTTATALLTDTTGRNRWQHKVDSVAYTATVPNTNLLYYFSTSAGEGKYPTVTISGVEYLSYSYYDHYNHSGISLTGLEYSATLLPETMTGTDDRPQLVYTQGLPVISRVKVLNEDHEDGLSEWELSVSYYDTKGRTIESRYKNATQSTTAQGSGYSSIRYDFANRPLITRSSNTNAAADQTAEEYYKYQYYTGSSRLFMSWHRTGSSTATWRLMQSLTYDDLGRISREILGGTGEVRDYTYNIRGQLESINGTYANTGNKEGKSRTFGEVLEYERTGNTVKRYDSRISSMIWRGSGGYKMRYDYQYDLAGRLLQADFDEYFGGSWTNSHLDYTVKNLSYDQNGNMLSMQQYGMGVVDTALQPVVLDYLSYTYETNSNRLLKVTDTVLTDYLAGDFLDGNTTNDYLYDASGSLTRDRNKDIDNVEYTFFNKPKKIFFKDGSLIEYIYNAAGVKLRETVLPDGGTAYKRDYVGNAIYKDDSLVYISTPQGRTLYDEETDRYTEEYFVKDHLGNVRSIIAVENILFTTEYLATYELSSAYIEGILFDVVGEIREENPEGGSYSGRLRADEYPVGTSLILQVTAGDMVSLEVKNRYDSYNPATDNLISDQSFFQNLLSTMITGPEGSPAEQGQIQLISSMFGSQNMSIFEMMSDVAMNPTRPPAALNYILYNNQLQIVGGGSGVIQADGLGSWSVIGTDGEIEIPENGFLSVFLSNRSLVTPVYFDDLRVGIVRGRLREENHYYPHGLPMAHMGTEAPGSIENRQKHQGNEYIKDLGLNWMDFAARQYDPQIGRFLGVDPLGDYYGQDRYSPYAAMGNQPESMVDPNGLAFGSTWFTPNASGPEQWGLSLGMAASSLDFMVKGLTNKSPIFPAHGGGGGTWGANGQGATLTINGQTMQLSMNGLALLLGGLSSGNLSINALSVNDITEEGTGSQPTQEGMSSDEENPDGPPCPNCTSPFPDPLEEGGPESSKELPKGLGKMESDDPLKSSNNENVYTLQEFLDYNWNLTHDEIINQRPKSSGFPGGPRLRYVLNPIDGNVMDMRHVLVVGYKYGIILGGIGEAIQAGTPNTYPSSFNPQDYYSNMIGSNFFNWEKSGRSVGHHTFMLRLGQYFRDKGWNKGSGW